MPLRCRGALSLAALLAPTLILFAGTLAFDFTFDDHELIGARVGELWRIENLPRYFVEGFWPERLLLRFNSSENYYRPLVTVLNALNLRQLTRSTTCHCRTSESSRQKFSNLKNLASP